MSVISDRSRRDTKHYCFVPSAGLTSTSSFAIWCSTSICPRIVAPSLVTVISPSGEMRILSSPRGPSDVLMMLVTTHEHQRGLCQVDPVVRFPGQSRPTRTSSQDVTLRFCQLISYISEGRPEADSPESPRDHGCGPSSLARCGVVSSRATAEVCSINPKDVLRTEQ
jgi:hypothetical protein